MERPDLIAHVNIGDITVPVLDPSLVTFSLPAPGYATDAIPGLDSPETGARIEEEGRPGLAQEGLQAAVEGQLSALDSMDDLQQSITAVSRAIINMHNGGDMEEDDGSDGGSHVSIDVDAIPGFNELPGVFKHTLLDTAASLAHVSEHDRTLNWTWLGLDEARYYRLENQPSVEHAETTIPNHCSVWVWGRRPLEPTIDQERQGKRQPLKEITPTPGRRIVVPGVKNEYYREDPNQIDSHETRWQYGELAMVCIFFPPTFGLTERDLHDISQSQEVKSSSGPRRLPTEPKLCHTVLRRSARRQGVHSRRGGLGTPPRSLQRTRRSTLHHLQLLLHRMRRVQLFLRKRLHLSSSKHPSTQIPQRPHWTGHARDRADLRRTEKPDRRVQEHETSERTPTSYLLDAFQYGGL